MNEIDRLSAATLSNAPNYGVESNGIELGDDELDRIISLIHRKAGIVLGRHKRGMVYARLIRRLRQLDLGSFRSYIRYLEPHLDGAEGEIFVNALTTNLTAFYRESHHFDILADFVSRRRGPIRIWCAAASTGEEAWSIAATLRQVLGGKADARVLATDIDTQALAHAKKGIYPLVQVEKHAARGITRYFLKGVGANTNQARVRSELAAMVDLMPLNLAAARWHTPGVPFDAIFCRNVMIYFDKPTQAKILSRFAPLLKPHGLLFAGHSESFTQISTDFCLQGKTVYSLGPAPV